MSKPDVFVIRLSSGRTIQLREGTRLSAEDLAGLGTSAADSAVAAVGRNPSDPTILGLQNLSNQAWAAMVPSGGQRRIEPGKNIKLAAGTHINFGPVTGDIGGGQGAFSLGLPSGQAIPLRAGVRLTASDLLGMGGVASGGSVAEVSRNPNDPTILGLKNLSSQPWAATIAGSGTRSILPGRSIKLAAGTSISFGGIDGEITIPAGGQFFRVSSFLSPFQRIRDSLQHIRGLPSAGSNRKKILIASAAVLTLIFVGWFTVLFPRWYEHRLHAALKVEEVHDPAVIAQVRNLASAPATLELAARLERMFAQPQASTGATLNPEPGSDSTGVEAPAPSGEAFSPPQPSELPSDFPTPLPPPLAQ